MATWQVIRWKGSSDTTIDAVGGILASEGLTGMAWSNGPGEIYTTHEHDFDKAIFVLRGSITFDLPATDETVTLGVGDRLELPAHTPHGARVGGDGVACVEAHR